VLTGETIPNMTVLPPPEGLIRSPDPRKRKGRPRGSTQNRKKLLPLEEEAKQFIESTNIKMPSEDELYPKELTAKLYLVGQAMSALMITSQGQARVNDIKREAYQWAEEMLKD